MLISKCKRAFALGLLATGFIHFSSLPAAVLTGVNPTIINVGTGSDISYLVIDESTLYSTPLEFVYHYTYDSNNLLTGYDLLRQVTNSSSLVIGTTPYSFGDALTSLKYGGNTVTAADSGASGTYWSYYDAGGSEVGYTDPPLNNWNYANVGMGSRLIAPSSWDGWTFASYGAGAVDTPPSVAPSAVPEPATLPLMLLSLAALIGITRWKSSTTTLKA